ncbi:restriction endonuclease subunit S [Synechococcus sp. MIT S1220]|uniref:restriction endonuclease subunit S n=1 Tax=Synechococcus sp. MIT S1220 TaxID=3082549 RepID=UPI0039AFD75D
MDSEWKDFRLGDLTSWSSGSTPSKKNESFWGGTVPWISASSMKQKALTSSDEMLTEEGVVNGGRLCQKGDVLLLVRGSELHKRIPIGVADCQVAFNQDVKAIRTSTENLKQDYLYHLLKGSENLLLSSVEFTGIGAGKLDTPFLQGLVFPLPPISEQDRICGLASALDDKIELNRKTNETLEDTAKALFKSWFVDFDPVRAKAEGRPTGLPNEISDLFPDSFEESELGEIPTGWSPSSVGEISKNLDRLRVPLSKKQRSEKQGSFPYYGATGVFDYVDDFLFDGDYLLIGEDGSVAKEDGTAFSQYVSGKIWVNNHAHVLEGVLPVTTEFLYCFFQFARVTPYVTGAVQLKLSQGRMNMIQLPLADEKLLCLFGEMVRPIFGRIQSIQKEILSLGELRDVLLPRLISGELRVLDAEKMLEEVGI